VLRGGAVVSTDPCRICGNAEANVAHVGREMMFGTRTPFDYVECGRCGCVQIAEIPEALGEFYPAGYHVHVAEPRRTERIGRVLTRLIAAVAVRLPVVVVDRLVERRCLPSFFRGLAGAGLTTRSRILDLGCGGGDLLVRLHRYGFCDLTGIDPHLDRTFVPRPGVRIIKGDVESLAERFDLVMLNHSLEHMAAPADALRAVRKRLTPGGKVLVRVPVADSEAWRGYGTDWVGLDPPRHLHVPTDRAMRELAGEAGFEVTRTYRDSQALQFWGSEQYRRDIPLRDPRSWWIDPERSPFTAAQVRAWDRRSVVLNRAGRGDTAGFILVPDTDEVSQ
jgi:SAM-dependent methyltransferase